MPWRLQGRSPQPSIRPKPHLAPMASRLPIRTIMRFSSSVRRPPRLPHPASIPFAPPLTPIPSALLTSILFPNKLFDAYLVRSEKVLCADKAVSYTEDKTTFQGDRSKGRSPFCFYRCVSSQEAATT